MGSFFFQKSRPRLLYCLAGCGIALSVTWASEARADCQSLVGSQLYRCEVLSSLGTRFSDCFQFRSRGFRSTGFKLLIEGHGSVQSCACKIGGTFTRPRFGASTAFLCATPPSARTGLALEGTALSRLRIRGEAVNDLGIAFAFSCRRVSRCVAPFFGQHAKDGSSWSPGN
jgi:hypothetical protein